MNRSQAFLLGLIAVFAALAFVIVLPVVEYVVVAALLAYVLHPLHSRLERQIGSTPSALAVIFGALLAVVGPVGYALWVFVSDLREIARGRSDLDVAAVETRLAEVTGVEVDVTDVLTAAAQGIFDALFGSVGGIVASALKIAMGLTVMIFMLYYLLLQGEAFVAWFRDLLPLPDRVTDRLLAKVDATTWGVVVGHVSVAIAQALIAGLGLWATGVPDAAFWTFVMAILALLPFIGAFMVWGPAAAYLVVVGETAGGVLLFLYGVTAVSIFDNYARPIVIDRRAKLNPGVLLLGVVGGIYAVGFTGVFVGPVVIGVLAATLETFRTEFDDV